MTREVAINRQTGRLATIFTPPQLFERRAFIHYPPEAADWGQEAGVELAPTEYDTIRRVPTRSGGAALDVAKEPGAAPVPEIMSPLVATKKELELMRNVVVQTAERVFNERKSQVEYLVGTMIEQPRAPLRAGDIAEEAEFLSFGTNDLTQTALGISRDDAARFVKTYEERGIYKKDPFVSIDRDGVGELVRIGCERGRAARPRLKLGVCGVHGGDPASVYFFEEVGLDYVSASPFRVPVARLAAAHAALKKGR